MAVIKMLQRNGKDRPSYLKKTLKYITNPDKITLDENNRLIYSWNCSDDPDQAYTLMRMTQQMYDQENAEKLFVHFVQSFPKDHRLTPEIAHHIGIELINRLKIFDGFEIVMGTHTDTETLHNHFVINRTNLNTGKRWNQRKPDLRAIKMMSAALCQEQQIKVDWIDHTEEAVLSTKSRGEYNKLKEGQSWKAEMEKSVIAALEKTSNKWEFMLLLQQYGYQTNWWDDREYLTFTNPHQFRCRSTTLHKAWTKQYFMDAFERKKLSEDNEANRYGYLKQLSKAHQEARCCVDYAIHRAVDKNQFILMLRQNGYDVLWLENRKNITVSKGDKTYRLATLMKPQEWTKEKLLKQFELNGENIRIHQSGEIGLERSDTIDLIDFSHDKKRLNACFNRTMRFARSEDEMIDYMSLYGITTLKSKDSYRFMIGESSYHLNELSRFNPIDLWTVEKVDLNLERNRIYDKYRKKYASYERGQHHKMAFNVRALQANYDPQSNTYFGQKLEGQALKELAIKLSSSEMMHWEDPGLGDYER